MSTAHGDRLSVELEHVRWENRALNEQVKLLVQIEQRLSRSQNEMDRQLARLSALADFALHSTGLDDVGEILGRAVDLLANQFNLDRVRAVQLEPLRAGLLAHESLPGKARTARTLPAVPDGMEWLETFPQAVVLPMGDGPPPELARLVLGLDPSATLPWDPVHGVAMCMPLRFSDGVLVGFILACRSRHAPASYFKTSLADAHVPYLRLLAAHLEHALQVALLTSDLRERGRELSETNVQLTSSLEHLERAQQQLLQARKMEAVGRLAGGVAHDFNNVLTVILSHAAVLLDGAESGSHAAEDLSQIIQAGERAAKLTGQLLAFSRKQNRRPEPLDLNALTLDMTRMLGRLIGEHITLDLKLDPGIRNVHADRGQIEQVMLNLIVNARDAMPQGGIMTVETQMATEEDAAASEGTLDARSFVVLSVQDTGEGMDDTTKAQIFEPFYTTKEPGRGTGMGLAMVYGIVQQSGGHISVASEPGRGARFSVLLPSASVIAPSDRPGRTGTPAHDTPATVLLAEDEESIRSVSARVLREHGYHVIVAADGEEALIRARAHDRPIDLLVTDVVMPRMGGRTLAATLQLERPTLRVLYMSGYTFENISFSGETGTDSHYMMKPFTHERLLRHVREALQPPAAG